VDTFTFERKGKTVHLVDTPGFDGTLNADTFSLEDIAAYLNRAYVLGIPINGIIYLHPITSNRLQGSARKCLRIIQKICGEDASSIILLGSTMWDKEDYETAQKREEELTANREFWGGMIENRSKTFRFHNDSKSALVACDYIIEQRRQVTLALQHQMVNLGRTLKETDAGLEIHQEILQLKGVYQARLKAVREEAQHALQKNQVQTTLALTETSAELHEQLRASEKALESLHGNMETLQLRIERKMQDELVQLRYEQQQDQQLISTKKFELDWLSKKVGELKDEDSTGSSHRSSGKDEGEELKKLVERCSLCDHELTEAETREMVRRKRIDIHLKRLNIAAGVLGAAFQVAGVAITLAACNVM
jgi:hypothetical protein